MGEIADDMTDGTSCCLCGQYFEDEKGCIVEHGYPVVCWECWDELTRKERKDYQRSLYPTLGAMDDDK